MKKIVITIVLLTSLHLFSQEKSENEVAKNEFKINALENEISKVEGKLEELKLTLRKKRNKKDVGKSALYLLSDLGSGVTGETLHVDAGYHVVGMKAVDAPDIDAVTGRK